MSTFTDDLAHVADQLLAARDQLRAAAPAPAVRAAVARLDDALSALEAVVDQLEQLQSAALAGSALRIARDLLSQPEGVTAAEVRTATSRSQAWVLGVLKGWVDAGVAARLGEDRYAEAGGSVL